MKNNFLSLALVFGFIPMMLIGCKAVRLTLEGREIVVVKELSALTTECTRLGSVTGQHKMGYDQALTIVRNKAASQYHADTVVIDSVEGRMSPSRRITATAFNCSERRVQPVRPVESKPLTSDVVTKAKKCQEKGGVWINDQCVLQVE